MTTPQQPYGQQPQDPWNAQPQFQPPQQQGHSQQPQVETPIAEQPMTWNPESPMKFSASTISTSLGGSKDNIRDEVGSLLLMRPREYNPNAISKKFGKPYKSVKLDYVIVDSPDRSKIGKVVYGSYSANGWFRPALVNALSSQKVVLARVYEDHNDLDPQNNPVKKFEIVNDPESMQKAYAAGIHAGFYEKEAEPQTDWKPLYDPTAQQASQQSQSPQGQMQQAPQQAPQGQPQQFQQQAPAQQNPWGSQPAQPQHNAPAAFDPQAPVAPQQAQPQQFQQQQAQPQQFQQQQAPAQGDPWSAQNAPF